jgi:hypothetical protein
MQRKAFLITVVTALTALFVLLAVLFATAPVFATIMLGCLSAGIVFVVTEGKDVVWHRAHEAENRYWSVVAFHLPTRSSQYQGTTRVRVGPRARACVLLAVLLPMRHRLLTLARLLLFGPIAAALVS